jgi:hypothetical protein
MRVLIILLVLVNGAYFLWAQGHLNGLGLGPFNPSEPQHLAAQIKPDSLKVLSAEDAKRMTAPVEPSAPATECLSAAALDAKTAAAVRTAATQDLPASQWSLSPITLPGRWIVYMGRYGDLDTLNRKKAELRARRISFEPLTNPSLEPGLSLGAFATQAAAAEALAGLAQRGVRTARVVQEQPDVPAFNLTLPTVDDSLRGKLESVNAILGAKGLRPC